MIDTHHAKKRPSAVRLGAVALATAAVMLGLNSLWYAVIMKGFYDRDTGSWGAITREDPSMVFILASFVTLAALMTIAYRFVSFGRTWWARGLALGIWSALVFIVPAGFYYFGTTDILAGEVLAADIGWHLIEESAAGLTIAALLARRTGVQLDEAPRREMVGATR